MSKHTYYTCPPDCDEPHCNYCLGGLAYCTVCKGAEGTLPTECPGAYMTARQEADVYAARLDFVQGDWVYADNHPRTLFYKLWDEMKAGILDTTLWDAFVAAVELSKVPNAADLAKEYRALVEKGRIWERDWKRAEGAFMDAGCWFVKRNAISLTQKWTLETGVNFARKLELAIRDSGFHVALGGSVLHVGHSNKDLDLFVYPHNTRTSHNIEEFRAALKQMSDFRLWVAIDVIHAAWAKADASEAEIDVNALKGSRKIVEVWNYGIRRVDVFYMHCERPEHGDTAGDT